MALTRKLLVITAAAKHDLADATRRLERFMADLDEGRFPDEDRSRNSVTARVRCGTRVISPFRV